LSEYRLPEEIRYSRDDEWVRESEGGLYTVGISDYAQQQLGDVVFVELPAPETKFDAGQAFGVIESVKAVSDLCIPIAGEIIEVNASLEDAPETVNDDCYASGWLVTLRPSDPSQIGALMDATAYASYIADRSD
jgi:glycine cleavage system H protein